MNDTAKVATAVAGGYLLGRRKKMKLALTLAFWLLGKRYDFDIKRLGREGLGMLASSGGVGKVTGEIREKLLAAGKGAALTALDSQANRLADRLHGHTEALSAPEGPRPDEDETDQAEDEEPDQEDQEGQDRPRRRRAAPAGERAATTPSRKAAPARKSARSADRRPARRQAPPDTARKQARRAAGTDATDRTGSAPGKASARKQAPRKQAARRRS